MSYLLMMRRVIATNTQYALGMFVQNIFLVVQALVALYTGLYFNGITHLKTPAQLFLYYAIGLAIINAFQRGNLVRRVEEEVENGDIAVHFTKPYNFIVHIILKDIATKIVGIIITALVIVGILGIVLGFYMPTAGQILRIILILPFTIFYIYLTNGIFAQLILIWEDAAWMVAIFGVSSFFLGGGLMPLAFLPNFAQYIPTAFYFGAPLAFIETGVYPNPLLFAVYAIMLLIANYLVYKYVQRRMQINGG